MKRVTLDTNELVLALSGGHRALRLLHMAIDGDIEIAMSEPIIVETIRALREKFDWPPHDLLDARQRLEKIGRLVEPREKLAVVADEPDNRILECAAEAGSNISSPRIGRYFRVKEHAGAKLVTASQFLELVGQQRARDRE